MRKKFLALAVTFVVSISVIGCGNTKDFAVKTLEELGVSTEQLQNISVEDFDSQTNKTTNTKNITETIPKYSGSAWIVVNSNKPLFTESDYTSKVFEKYSDLDSLGRCGAAFANICKDIMPTEERGEIGMVKPSGWHTVKYNGMVEGNYLYNRFNYGRDHMISNALERAADTVEKVFEHASNVKEAFKDLGRALTGKERQNTKGELSPRQQSIVNGLRGISNELKNEMQNIKKDFEVSKNISILNVKGAIENREESRHDMKPSNSLHKRFEAAKEASIASKTDIKGIEGKKLEQEI